MTDVRVLFQPLRAAQSGINFLIELVLCRRRRCDDTQQFAVSRVKPGPIQINTQAAYALAAGGISGLAAHPAEHRQHQHNLWRYGAGAIWEIESNHFETIAGVLSGVCWRRNRIRWKILPNRVIPCSRY